MCTLIIMDKVQSSRSCDVLVFIHNTLFAFVVGYSYRIRFVVLRIHWGWSKQGLSKKQCQSAYLTNSGDKL